MVGGQGNSPRGGRVGPTCGTLVTCLEPHGNIRLRQPLCKG